jgi:photosystem II stability/assembly factor-like uncharacterized protein
MSFVKRPPEGAVGVLAFGVLLLLFSVAAFSLGSSEQAGKPMTGITTTTSNPRSLCSQQPAYDADVDGDGRNDYVYHLYLHEPGGGRGALGVCTFAGEWSEIDAGSPEAGGVVDIEPDGRDELLFGGTTVSRAIECLAVFLHGQLRVVATRDGDLCVVGGTGEASGEIYSNGCRDVDGDGVRELIQVEVPRDGKWTRRAYRITGAQAVLLSEERGNAPPADGGTFDPWPEGDELARELGGDSCDRSSVPPGFHPSAVSFVNATEGWVLGEALCPEGQCPNVLHTRDGGRLWEATAAPKTSGASGGGRSAEYVSDIRFADRKNGWVFNRELWASHDGGASWHPVPIGNPVLSLEAAAGRVYAVVGSCPLSTVECTGPVRLYEAEVGSDDWRSVLEVELEPRPYGGGLSHNGDLVVHGGAAYLTVDRYGSAREDGEPPLLFARSPAGRWERRQMAPCDWGGVLAASSPRDLVFVCLTGEGVLQEGVYEIYASANGGTSWKLRRSEGRVPHVVAVAVTTEASFLARNIGQLDVERRDGRRYSVEFDASGESELVGSIRFVDPRHGIVLAGNLVYITRDAGLTWSPVKFQR